MCGGGGEGGRRWFGFKVREGGERVSGMAGGAPGWSGVVVQSSQGPNQRHSQTFTV